MPDFEDNMGLVYKVFNDKFHDARYLEDDLIQEGTIELWKACQEFDESRGVKFSTYATKRISNAMSQFFKHEKLVKAKCISLETEIDSSQAPATYLDVEESDDYENMMAEMDKQDQEKMLEKVMSIVRKTPQYKIIKMKLEGKTQAQIAKKLGITQCSVSEQVRGLYARIRNELGIDISKKK